MKMTSAAANKMLKKLQEDKQFYITKETECCKYIAAVDEEPVIPEYDFMKVSVEITEIDKKIVRLKHAINMANCSNTITVGDEELTIDSVLVRMAQLNSRKAFLDQLRKAQPKARVEHAGYMAIRKSMVEYQYINYDLEDVGKMYDEVDTQLVAMQMALDRYNQTFEFDVDI